MKFLATDLDGTLLHENVIVEGNKEAIQELRKQGNKLIIATGRDLRGVQDIENPDGLEYDYLVLCNGAIVLDNNLNLIHKAVIGHEIAYDIIENFKNEEKICAYVGYEGKSILLSPGNTDDLGRVVTYFSHIEEIENVFNTEREYSMVSFFARDSSIERTEVLLKKLVQKYGDILEVVRNQFSIDIMPKNCSKGNGIKMVLDIEKNHVDNLYTIGDSYNDLSMLKITKNSYTFKNAEDKVKEEANKYVDYVHECIKDITK